MFEQTIGHSLQASKEAICQPNYEDVAKRIKITLDANKKCLDGMIAGTSNGNIDLNREQATLFYAIIGYLYINIPKYEKEYERILKKIEEQK